MGLDVDDPEDKKKIDEIVQRTQVVEKGLNKMLDTVEHIWKNVSSIIPDQVEDLIIIDTVLTHTPSWPLAIHLFTGTFCLGCSAMFHLCQIKSPKM